MIFLALALAGVMAFIGLKMDGTSLPPDWPEIIVMLAFALVLFLCGCARK